MYERPEAPTGELNLLFEDSAPKREETTNNNNKEEEKEEPFNLSSADRDLVLSKLKKVGIQQTEIQFVAEILKSLPTEAHFTVSSDGVIVGMVMVDNPSLSAIIEDGQMSVTDARSGKVDFRFFEKLDREAIEYLVSRVTLRR